jgi:hypothetical protein
MDFMPPSSVLMRSITILAASTASLPNTAYLPVKGSIMPILISAGGFGVGVGVGVGLGAGVGVGVGMGVGVGVGGARVTKYPTTPATITITIAAIIIAAVVFVIACILREDAMKWSLST